MREHLYFVYILASRRNGTLYVGVTNDVMRRTWQHKNDLVEGFTKKYGVHILVWFEMHGDIRDAIAREASEALEPRLEDQAYRREQFRVERSVRQNDGRNLVARPTWVPFPSRR